jgi:hypothetical protein
MTGLDDMTSVELHEWRSRPFKDEIAKLRAEIAWLRATIRDAADALERGSTSAPVLESLKAALKDTNAMTDQRYMRPGLDFAVGKAIEEAGEFQAAIGS